MANLRALVVDDSEHLRRLVRHVLKRFFDMEVVEAANGAAALAELERTRFDLIIADLKMPVLDGVKFIREVRGKEATQEIPIIVATADADEQTQKEALEAGANRYLTKPLQANHVADAVCEVLGVKKKSV